MLQCIYLKEKVIHLDVNKIKLLKKNINILDSNRNIVVETWLFITEVRETLQKHDVDVEMFATEYAHPVLSYFIGVIEGVNKVGNCPVITKLLEYLKDKNISASELFIICINFRKAMINLFFQKNLMSEEMYSNISFIFDSNFKGVLESFSDTISKANAQSRYFYDISTKDHLTQIFNRKKFDEIFHEEIAKANTLNNVLSLIIIDIDHFKRVNDNFGHTTGDSVLVEVVKIIQNHIRRSDIFARWGGEEFVILMPKATKENANTKTELIRQAIESYTLDKVGNITCSFGITDYKQADTQSSMFHRSDKALYESKANGRNRITLG